MASLWSTRDLLEYYVNVTQTVRDISPLTHMHQDPLLVWHFIHNRVYMVDADSLAPIWRHRVCHFLQWLRIFWVPLPYWHLLRFGNSINDFSSALFCSNAIFIMYRKFAIPLVGTEQQLRHIFQTNTRSTLFTICRSTWSHGMSEFINHGYNSLLKGYYGQELSRASAQGR